ncbi:MAG: T9SS type A sorting domain-containing protein [Burkholderiales bacterium]|nr:T9SS type A sorting domain-containing protein [Bacteroidia bacterium]
MAKLYTCKFKFVVKVFTLLCVLNVSKSWGQISIPNTTPVTENFDAMGVSATASLPANWKFSDAGNSAPTWANAGNFTAVNIQASSGNPVTGGRYNWGTTLATDRALGVMTSAGYASPNSIMAFYQNTNAGNLTQLAVSYDLERYRINTTAASVQFYYSLDGSTWIAAAVGDVPAATIGTGVNAYIYAPQATFPVGSFNITGLNISTNGSIYLRWNLNTGASNSQGIGIDNVSVTATFCTPPTTTITPTSQTVCANVTTAITVTSSATSPGYQWQMSASGSGPFINVANGTPTGVTYTSGTTAATLSAIGTASAQYFYQCLVTNVSGCTATSGTVSLTIKAAPSITSQPTSVYTTTAGIASYTVAASGTGLTYQWQENGSPIANGGVNPTYAGATASVLNVTNPLVSMSGHTFQCVVANSCGTVTTDGISTITVTSIECPTLKGAFIDACAGTCGEAQGEAVFLNTGDYSVNVTTVSQATANVNLWYGTTTSLTQASDHLTNTYVNNAAAVTCLNSFSGCAGTFVDALGTTIPTHAEIMIVRSDFCCSATPDNNFSGLCGSGAVIYVLFSNDANWNSGGQFKNNTAGCGMRYFQLNSASTSCTFTTNYDACSLTPFSSSNDGGTVTWPASGGAPSSYVNTGCNVPKVILPIDLLDFYATKNGKKNDVVWKVAYEEYVGYYTIDKSNDGMKFTELATVFTNNETERKTYSVIDDTPFDDITYYRLGTKEKNGKVNYYKIISVDEKSSEWNSIHYQQQQNLVIEFKKNLPKNSTITVYNLSGQLLVEKAAKESQTIINTEAFAEGIYFVRITTPYKTENFKIIISK